MIAPDNNGFSTTDRGRLMGHFDRMRVITKWRKTHQKIRLHISTTSNSEVVLSMKNPAAGQQCKKIEAWFNMEEWQIMPAQILQNQLDRMLGVLKKQDAE